MFVAGYPALRMRTRPLAFLIALSFVLAACQSGSLPPRSAEDKTSPAAEQTSAAQEDTAIVEPPVVESVSEDGAAAQEQTVAQGEQLVLAELPDAAEAEIEQAPLVGSADVRVGLLLPLSGPLAREGRRFSMPRNWRCATSPTSISPWSRAIPAARHKVLCKPWKVC